MNQVPNHISEGLRQAIHRSIEKEKAPFYLRTVKALVGAMTLSLCVLAAYVYLLKEQAFHHGISFFISFFVILFAGFYLYFKPEPRWIIKGHWSGWSYGKLFVLMGLLTAAQFLICPHFVLLHLEPNAGFSPLEELAWRYRDWGGVEGSKFLCGATFSALSSAVIFLVFRKQFWTAKSQDLLKVLSLLFIAQAPTLLIQLMDGHLRDSSYLWLAGSLAALALFGFLLRLIGRFQSA